MRAGLIAGRGQKAEGSRSVVELSGGLTLEAIQCSAQANRKALMIVVDLNSVSISPSPEV